MKIFNLYLMLIVVLILTQMIVKLNNDQLISKIEAKSFAEADFPQNTINGAEKGDFLTNLTFNRRPSTNLENTTSQNTVSSNEPSSDTIKKDRKTLIDRGYGSKEYLIDSVLSQMKTVLIVTANTIKEQERYFVMDLGSSRGEFLWAMVFGNPQALPGETKSLLQQVGLQHLLTISGFNLSLLLLLIESILSKVPFRQAFYFLLILLPLIYMQVVGFSVVMLRAVAMLGLAFISKSIFRRPFLPVYGLSILSVLILLISPTVFSDLSFQFSTIALMGIYLFSPFLTRLSKGGLIWKIFLPSCYFSLVVFVCTLPLVIFHFGEINLLAVLVNICLSWTMPVLTGLGIVYCVFLLVSSGFGHIFAMGLRVILNIFFQTVTIFTFLPKMTFSFPQTVPVWFFILWWGCLLWLRQLLSERYLKS
jgi:ComEC/Rec2-related protein